MTDKTRQVLNGWVKLTDSEKRDFDAEVQKFQRSGELQRKDLRESFRAGIERMETGPLGGGCACCGR